MRLFLLIVMLVHFGGFGWAQTFYVDVVHGRDGNPGTVEAPLASLGRAVEIARDSRGLGRADGRVDGAGRLGEVRIKVAPGLYTLKEPVVVGKSGAAGFVIEAMKLPDDSGWLPGDMPVIQCVADSNRKGTLAHASVGLLIECSQVAVRGLKFLGNPNPASAYYYAIERRDSTLAGLDISHCYFVGDKRSAPMQGGVLAQGPGISVDHCYFYGAKNAVLVFLGLRDFSMTHCVVVGAYEGALWYGYGPSSDRPFLFSDNIVADGNYFFVGFAGRHHGYVFCRSLIAGNAHFMGFNGIKISPDQLNRPKEVDIRRRGWIDAGLLSGKPTFWRSSRRAAM